MDTGFTDEQTLLRESARDFLAAHCPIALVRSVMDDPEGRVDTLWAAMADLGWTGLTIPEKHGGAGLGLVDLAVLAEQMGRALLPAPFLSTVVLGAGAVAALGSPAQQQRILPAVASGQLRLALAHPEPGTWHGPDGVQLLAERSDSGFRLTGAKSFVPDAQLADVLVVPGRTGLPGPRGDEGITAFLVDATAPNVSVTPIPYTDGSRKVCEIRFEGVEIQGDAVLGEIGAAWSGLTRVIDAGKVALCAEMCGGAYRVLELSVEYAKQREQFGRPIGSFQAIQHKCADMLVQAEAIRSAAYYAAWSLSENEPDGHTSACLAKAFCSEAYARIAGEGIQIHGGLGFTWEQDLHLYYKRAKADEQSYGSPSYNRELAARVLIDGE